MIDINDITLRIGSKVLLERASAHISDGWKVGLVGRNGCGKSTLFRALQGKLETEQGDIFVPSGCRVASVAQELDDTDVPVLDFVLAQDKERTALLKRLETAPEEEYGEIHEQLRVIGAASAEGRAAAILTGLGFAADDLRRPIKEFSGGWRMRVALAAALFRPSDVLLLDEPTNHLDLEAGIWLENHLRRYGGTLLLISHDRFILNDLCDYIVHFENKKLNVYSGNYDTFQQTRSLQREVQARQIAKQEMRRRHLQSFVDRFRYKASKAKQAQSRLKMLEKIEALPPLSAECGSSFDFPEPPETASPLITLEGVSVGYGEKVVLKNLSLRIVENDRIALLGANGNGKSTFAKLISGRLAPMDGSLMRTKKLEIGYFAQHQSEELPLDMTACAYMATLMPGMPEPKVRAHLARFGLTQEKSATLIGKLSGGEKARLLFAVMSRNAPGLLILDEPTNHLDIEGRDALIEALNVYKGAVVLITHDLHLTELIADDLWLVRNHSCKPYDGDLEDYRRSLLEDENAVKKTAEPAKKEDRPKSAGYRETKQLNSDVRRLEKLLSRLGDEKAAMTRQFETPMTTDELIALQKDYAALQNRIDETENEWLALSEKLEKL